MIEEAVDGIRNEVRNASPDVAATQAAGVTGVVIETVGGIHNEARKASPDFAAMQAAVEL